MIIGKLEPQIDPRTLDNRALDVLIARWLGDELRDGRWYSLDGSIWTHADGGPRLYTSDWNLIKPIALAMEQRLHATLRTSYGADVWGARFWADWETGAITGGTFSEVAYTDDLPRAVVLAALQGIARIGHAQ